MIVPIRLRRHTDGHVALSARPGCWTVTSGGHADDLPSSTRYPGTNFLTLCTLEGRKGGSVTVSESRLSVAGVLAMLREHGTAEAAVMWPQLSEMELTVLERLVRDMDERESDDEA